MARARIKLAHERQALKLRTEITQSRIAIQDHRDRIAKKKTELAQLKGKPSPSSS